MLVAAPAFAVEGPAAAVVPGVVQAEDTDPGADTDAPDAVDTSKVHATPAKVIGDAGAAEAGATVKVSNAAGTELGSAVVDEDGSFTVSFEAGSEPAVEDVLTLVVVDAAGNASGEATVTVAAEDTDPGADTDAPDAVDTSKVHATPAKVIGDAGAAEAGATVKVSNAAGTELGSATVSADGSFTVTYAAGKAPKAGDKVSLTVTDAAGNTSEAKTVTVQAEATTPSCSVVPFSDVKDSVHFSNICWMWQQKYVVSADKFNPTSATTRAAMSTMLMRVYEQDKNWQPTKPLPFTDVKKTDTQYRGIAWMYEHGYVIAADKFNPGSPVTRGAMAAMLMRINDAGYVAKTSATLSGFKDVKPSDTFYRPIAWMAEHGYAAAADAYNAKGSTTRGAMSSFLRRVVAPDGIGQ